MFHWNVFDLKYSIEMFLILIFLWNIFHLKRYTKILTWAVFARNCPGRGIRQWCGGLALSPPQTWWHLPEETDVRICYGKLLLETVIRNCHYELPSCNRGRKCRSQKMLRCQSCTILHVTAKTPYKKLFGCLFTLIFTRYIGHIFCLIS